MARDGRPTLMTCKCRGSSTLLLAAGSFNRHAHTLGAKKLYYITRNDQVLQNIRLINVRNIRVPLAVLTVNETDEFLLVVIVPVFSYSVMNGYLGVYGQVSVVLIDFS